MGSNILSERFKTVEDRLAQLEQICNTDPALRISLRWARIEQRTAAMMSKLGLQEPSSTRGQEACSGSHGKAAHWDGFPDDEGETNASPTQARLTKELQNLGFTKYRFVRVPADYYDQPLEYRQECLKAPTIDHLCKSIISENTRAHPSVVHENPLDPANWKDWNNSRYYCIIVQYTARLHFEKLKTFIHRLNEGKVGRQYFNMRLAPEDVNDALSGYSHNAVSPIGMAARLPMVMSHKIAELEPNSFFAGAGEVDLKVQLSVREFIDKYKPWVADITY